MALKMVQNLCGDDNKGGESNQLFQKRAPIKN